MIKHIQLHFSEKTEFAQYNSALSITGAIKGTSKKKLYHELGLESLEKRRWYRKRCLFYKIFRNQISEYLFNIISTSVRSYNTKNANNIPQFKVKHNFFHNSFIPSVVIEWNKLDQITRKFKHGFLDSLNPICICGQDIETSAHFILHCSNYSNRRLTFLNIIRNIDSNILSKNNLKVTKHFFMVTAHMTIQTTLLQ